MNRKRKVHLILAGMAVGILVFIIALKLILDLPYRKNLPALPDMGNLPVPLQEQISKASGNAHFYPSSVNIGIL